MEDPQVQAALQVKYTARGRDLPAIVNRGQCVDRLELKDAMLKLDTGVSPGFGGMRNEHLRCFAEFWKPRDMALLEGFGLRYLNGEPEPRPSEATGCHSPYKMPSYFSSHFRQF